MGASPLVWASSVLLSSVGRLVHMWWWASPEDTRLSLSGESGGLYADARLRIEVFMLFAHRILALSLIPLLGFTGCRSSAPLSGALSRLGVHHREGGHGPVLVDEGEG